jgi:hypothetical protein
MAASSPSAASALRFENEPPTQVLPFLYVGNARDSTNRPLLAQLGIRYILSLTTTPTQANQSITTNPLSPSQTPNTTTTTTTTTTVGDAGAESIRTKWIPVSDNLTENLAPYFEDACNFIGELLIEINLMF